MISLRKKEVVYATSRRIAKGLSSRGLSTLALNWPCTLTAQWTRLSRSEARVVCSLALSHAASLVKTPRELFGKGKILRWKQILSKLETKVAVIPLTFVVAEAEVALPAARIDETDERVDVGATRATAHYHIRLDHRQVLKQGTLKRQWWQLMRCSIWGERRSERAKSAK